MKLPLAHGVQARAMAHALPRGTELRDAVAELPPVKEGILKEGFLKEGILKEG